MKVFTEWHHGGLFHAQQMLWEGRIGGQLSAPVGYEWAKEGIWQYSKNPDTIKQYLNPEFSYIRDDGSFYYYDKGEEINQKRITLEQFKKTKFDIILCTLQEHEKTFLDIRNKYQPQAKYIRLVGNTGEQVNWYYFNNFIDTTGLYQPPSHINSIVMGQEFPTKTFYYEEPKNHKTILNLMNCLKEADAYHVWLWLKNQLTDYKFWMHGSLSDDGMIDGLEAIGNKIRECAFLFQVKHHGEGFGHIIHNAYACGRPAIVVLEYYKGKLAEHFLIDGYSAILLDNKEPEQVLKEIKHWSEPKRHREMCQNARALFEKYVDFNKDYERFKRFLLKLQP